MNYLYFLYIEFLKKHNIPQLFGDITYYAIPFCIIAAALLVVVILLVLVERKLLDFLHREKALTELDGGGCCKQLQML